MMILFNVYDARQFCCAVPDVNDYVYDIDVIVDIEVGENAPAAILTD